MTTLQAKSINESLLIGVPSSSPRSAKANITYLEVNAAKPISIPNTTSIDDLVKEFETDGEMATAIAQARSNLAETLYGHEPITFSSIRLSAGLSQAQLAARAETSQPYIARIEAGKNDPGTDVIARIANALQKEESLVFTAIRNQRKMRESQDE